MVDFEADNIVSEAVADYLDDLAGDSPGPADAMEREAARRDFPIVGPQVGRFLSLLSEAIDPTRIVEMGSGFGYSAFWFGRGIADAEIHLTEYDADNLESARDYLSSVEGSNRYHFHQGDALDILDSLDDPIDLIFIDLGKEDYPRALERAKERLGDGDWLIADNVLWKGKVAQPEETDEATEAIRTFNRTLQENAWNASILPIRDGLAIARRRR